MLNNLSYRRFSKTPANHLSKLLTAAALVLAPTLYSSTAAAAEETTLEEVVVTGTLIKGIDAEKSLPVTIITAEEIAKSGVANLEQLVTRISSTGTAGATRGSQLAGQSTYGLSSVSLRGLGESRTLVLLNGRRLSPLATGTSAAVDINSIPLSAIERVDVLRDGASASYGADAVAGVINFVLRRDYNGAEVTADIGRPTEKGGGGINRINILMGSTNFFDGKVSAMAGGDIEKSEALFAQDRAFSASGNRPPYFQNAATPSGRIEGIWLPGVSSDDNARDPATNPLGYSSSGYGNPFAPNRCGDINMFAAQGTGGVGGAFSNCLFDSAPFVDLFPTTEHYDMFGTLNVEISDNASLYAEANYSRNRITEAYQPSPVRVGFLSTDLAFEGSGVDPALLVYPSNPAYQSILVPYFQSHSFVDTDANGNPVTVPLSGMIGKPVAVSLRTFLTGPRTEQDTNTQTRIVAGIRGKVSSWDYDVGALFNQTKTAGAVIKGYFSQLELARILNNPANNWNPWAIGGVQTPDLTSKLQATEYVGPTLSGETKLESVDATANGAVGTLSGGDIKVALGATGRRESYKVGVPAILGSGDIAGLGGATLPADNSRTVYALYAEANTPWTAAFSTDVSARFDHYSDFGSTTNGKLSARWQPVKSFLVRAAVGSGFRAPTLPELYEPKTTGTSEEFTDPLFPGDGSVQANAINGGKPDLKPEKSRQASLGVVLSPIEGLTASVDGFYIKINDYISTPTAIELITATRAGNPGYGPLAATFNPDGTVDTVDERYVNAGSVLVKGIDVNIDWTHKLPVGTLDIALSGTYMATYDLVTLAGVQHSIGTVVQPDGASLIDVAGDGGVISRWKHTLTFNYNLGPWSATLAQNYFAGYRDVNDLNDDRHDVPKVIIYDAQLTYDVGAGTKLSIGAKNLLNKDPPIFIGTQNVNLFQYGYDPSNYDPRGRFVYVRATLKFL
jgi:iron complex outermembrane receptor protein